MRVAEPTRRAGERAWRIAVPALLLALAVLSVLSCDDADEPGAVVGSRIFLTATPNPVHLQIDPAGTSVLKASLTDLSGTDQVGETVNFLIVNDTGGAGSLNGSGTSVSAVTDANGEAEVPFTSASATIAGISVTWGTVNPLSTSLNVLIRSELATTLTINSANADISTCSAATPDQVTISGSLTDADGFAVNGADITLSIVGGTPVLFDGCFGVDSMEDDCTEPQPPAIFTGPLGTYSATFSLNDETDCTANCVGVDCTLTIRATFALGSVNSTTDLTVTESVP